MASDGPRVVLIFSGGETQGSGFKAKYSFETGRRVSESEGSDVIFVNAQSTGSLGRLLLTALVNSRIPLRLPKGVNSTLHDSLQTTPLTSTASTRSMQSPTSK